MSRNCPTNGVKAKLLTCDYEFLNHLFTKVGKEDYQMEEILTAKDLCKTFSNGSVQQHVLKNLNLSVIKGDFTVIMGNSGSGKST